MPSKNAAKFDKSKVLLDIVNGVNMLFATRLVCLLLCVELTILEVAVGSVKQLTCPSVSTKTFCDNSVTVEYYCNVENENLNWGISRNFEKEETIVLGKSIIHKHRVFDIGTARLLSVGTENGRGNVSGAVSTLTLNITAASIDGKGDIRVSCQDLGDKKSVSCPFIDLSSNTPVPANLHRALEKSQNDEFAISWEPPKSNFVITGYRVTINPPPLSGPCAKGSCLADPDTSCSRQECTFAVNYLDHSKEYYIALQSINCAGTSASTEPLFIPATDQSTDGMHVKIASSTTSLYSYDASHVVPTLSLTAHHLPASPSSTIMQGSNISSSIQADSILWMALLMGAITLSTIVCTPVLVLVLVWCCISAKKQQSKQKESNDNAQKAVINHSHLASKHSYHEPEPIYEIPVPSWSTNSSKPRSSMMYNGAYRGGFVMSTNIAYRDEFIVSENDAYDKISNVRNNIEMSNNKTYSDTFTIRGYQDMSGNGAYSTSIIPRYEDSQ